MRKFMMFIALLATLNIFGQLVSIDSSKVCILAYSESKKVIEQISGSASLSQYQIKRMPPLMAFRVPVMTTFTRGTYSISVANDAEMMEDCNYELEDLLTGVMFDLRKGSYSFHVNRNVSERFVIYIRPRVQKLVNSK